MKQYYSGTSDRFVYRYNVNNFKYCGVELIGRCARFCYEFLATKSFKEGSDNESDSSIKNKNDDNSYTSTIKSVDERFPFPVSGNEINFTTNIENVTESMW